MQSHHEPDVVGHTIRTAPFIRCNQFNRIFSSCLRKIKLWFKFRTGFETGEIPLVLNRNQTVIGKLNTVSRQGLLPRICSEFRNGPWIDPNQTVLGMLKLHPYSVTNTLPCKSRFLHSCARWSPHLRSNAITKLPLCRSNCTRVRSNPSKTTCKGKHPLIRRLQTQHQHLQERRYRRTLEFRGFHASSTATQYVVGKDGARN